MKDSGISQELWERSSRKSEILELKYDSPVLSFLPPFLLRELPPGEFRETNFHFEYFSNAAELLEKNPGADLRRGHPYEIHRYLSGSTEAYLDFDGLGCVSLSHEPSGAQSPHTKMTLWLNYALSPELWGPEGKWSRFHAPLQKLFEDKKLLDGPAVPGYYPLKSNAISWEKYPLSVDRKGSVTSLVLPWTFSLTDLRRLIEMFSKEP